jgi:LysM repeat protein
VLRSGYPAVPGYHPGVTERAPSPAVAAGACPFVAFEDDRDHRSEVPDRRNRCYAEPVPRPPTPAHQAAYCLSIDFPSCAVFQAWAARAAAAPDATPVPQPAVAETEGALEAEREERDARGEPPPGAAPPEPAAGGGGGPPAATPSGDLAPGDRPPGTPPGRQPAGTPSPEPSRADPPVARPRRPRREREHEDWVPTTAWAAPGVAPWADDLDDPTVADARSGPSDPSAAAQPEDDGGEADPVTPPRASPPVSGGDASIPERPPEDGGPVPAARVAAIPPRRRKAEPAPLRALGSGEWESGSPPGREALVPRRRMGGIPARIGLLATVLAALALVVLLLPTLLGGGAPGTGPSPSPGQEGVAATASPEAPGVPLATSPVRPAPVRTPGPEAEPSPPESPAASPQEAGPQRYRVRAGDTLSRIAARFGVSVELIVCVNGLSDPNVLSRGQRLVIPEPDQECPAAEDATPPPED